MRMTMKCYQCNPLRSVLGALALLLVPAAQAQYGTGVVADVPKVDSGVITLDGNADESAWDDALEIDLTTNWDGEWSGHPDPDVAAFAKVLYAEGMLYVTVTIEDYQDFYWGFAGNPWGGEQILVGIDATHAGDDQKDDSFGGWTYNMPNAGPTAYKVWRDGITANWGYEDIFPVDSGWVSGEVVVDEETFSWGVEMGIPLAEVTEGGMIGFNIGGATASLEQGEENPDSTGAPTDGAYAYFAWQVCDNPTEESFCHYAGGNVTADAESFATLRFVAATAAAPAEQVQGIRLDSAYPNPFRQTATVSYTLQRPSDVTLAVYDVLGRRVATLAEGLRAAGTEHVRFDGSALPSGTYLIELRAAGQLVGTRTLQLLK